MPNDNIPNVFDQRRMLLSNPRFIHLRNINTRTIRSSSILNNLAALLHSLNKTVIKFNIDILILMKLKYNCRQTTKRIEILRYKSHEEEFMLLKNNIYMPLFRQHMYSYFA